MKVSEIAPYLKFFFGIYNVKIASMETFYV